MDKNTKIWWDMTTNEDKSCHIVIETTDQKHKILGSRPYSEENLNSAIKFIKDVREGRKNYRKDIW